MYDHDIMFMSRATVVHICCFLQELHFFFSLSFSFAQKDLLLKKQCLLTVAVHSIFCHLQTKHLSRKGNGTASQVRYLRWKLQGEIATDFSDSLCL